MTVLLQLLWEDICTLVLHRRSTVKHNEHLISLGLVGYQDVGLLDDFGMTYPSDPSTLDISFESRILYLSEFHPCSLQMRYICGGDGSPAEYASSEFPPFFQTTVFFGLDLVYVDVGRCPISSRPPVPTSEFRGALQCQ